MKTLMIAILVASAGQSLAQTSGVGLAWEYPQDSPRPSAWKLTVVRVVNNEATQNTVNLTTVDPGTCQAWEKDQWTADTLCAVMPCPGEGAYQVLLQADTSEPSDLLEFGLEATCKELPFQQALEAGLPVAPAPTMSMAEGPVPPLTQTEPIVAPQVVSTTSQTVAAVVPTVGIPAPENPDGMTQEPQHPQTQPEKEPETPPNISEATPDIHEAFPVPSTGPPQNPQTVEPIQSTPEVHTTTTTVLATRQALRDIITRYEDELEVIREEYMASLQARDGNRRAQRRAYLEAKAQQKRVYRQAMAAWRSQRQASMARHR